MGSNIGTDIGYGFTKTCTEKGTKIFPTAITQMVPVATFSEVKVVTVDDEKFLVGEDALREGRGLINTRTTAFVKSDAWIAVLGHALSVNFTPEETAGGTIILGIPPGQYNKQYANEIVDTIKHSVINCDGKIYPLHKNTIRVVPQGVGIYFSCASLIAGIYDKDVAVIDMGHHTLDMLFLSKGKYSENTVRSLPLGISVLMDAITKEFYNKYRISINQQEAGKLLRDGKITILDEPYTIEGMENIVVPYVAQVASTVEEYFENLPNKPEMGIVGGGGILMLKGYMKLKYKLYIANNPEYANAHGYLCYANKISVGG